MKIGIVGAGKLGLPYALAMERYGGHAVMAAEVSPEVRQAIAERRWPHKEAQVPELLRTSALQVVDSVAPLVDFAELILIAVQTPHGPGFEGVTVLGEERRDFDYTALVGAVTDLVAAAGARPLRLAVVSTVLPGTMAKYVQPLLRPGDSLVYMPSFIAMSTTITDLLAPEFILCGGSDEAALEQVRRLWERVNVAPVFFTTIVTAETIKVTYNAVIGAKVMVANAIMEVCERVGANADDVQVAFSLATKRLASAAYFGGGMGDGGPCHGRDGIALSWLARELHLSADVFGDMMVTREKQTRWLAEMAAETATATALPLVIVGQSYKAGTNITTGSPAVLLTTMLAADGVGFTVWDDTGTDDLAALVAEVGRAVYFVTVRDARVYAQRWPEGAVVIDPWGRVADQPGVTVKRVGRP